MNSDAEMLTYLFGLSREQIDADLASAGQNLEELLALSKEFHATPFAERTPAQNALDHHRHMLRAHALRQRPNLPEDAGLLVVATAVEHVANDACSASHRQGRLGELSRKIDKIKKREGLAPGEDWMREEGPPDYQEVVGELDKLYEQIGDTIKLQMLRRYRFDSLADLFENDRGTYEVRREVGRRILRKSEPEDIEHHAFTEEYIRTQYGNEAAALLRRRLSEEGLE